MGKEKDNFKLKIWDIFENNNGEKFIVWTDKKGKIKFYHFNPQNYK